MFALCTKLQITIKTVKQQVTCVDKVILQVIMIINQIIRERERKILRESKCNIALMLGH